jgi:hypothetical protein
MITTKIFLASSSELKEDRIEFEIFISRKNKDLVNRGVFLEITMWEDFLDAMSQTRLQDEYNKAIRDSDIFVMLFSTKVGQYTEEEFETAFGQFKVTKKPVLRGQLSSPGRSWGSVGAGEPFEAFGESPRPLSSRQDRSTAQPPLALARRGRAIPRLHSTSTAFWSSLQLFRSLSASPQSYVYATKATPGPIRRPRAKSRPKARATEAAPR